MLTSANGRNKQTTFPATVPDKQQPHNVEAEEAVLGALLIDPDAMLRVGNLLTAADFYIERNGWIFDVIHSLYARPDSAPADLLLVCDELERRGQLKSAGGHVYLTDLISRTPSAINADFYAGIVARAAGLRRLIRSAGEISRLAFADEGELSDINSKAEEIIFTATNGHNNGNGPQPIQAGIERFHDRLEYLNQHDNTIIGIPTGLSDLDRLLGGLQRTDMIVLAGRPGMGKTSLALSIALNAARQYKTRSGIFSLEMSEEQLIQRLVASETGIDSQRLRHGKINEEEWPVVFQAEETLINMPIFIDDAPTLTALELRSKARRLYAEYGLDLLIVDYLQLMHGDRKSENRQQEVSVISRSVKALARELKIPVLALSQLSRNCESRHNKRPILSDLRESGSLEQDADVVMFIYRDEIYNPNTEFPNITEIIVGKQRHGPTGVLSAYFKKHLTRFVDLEIHKQVLEQAP